MIRYSLGEPRSTFHTRNRTFAAVLAAPSVINVYTALYTFHIYHISGLESFSRNEHTRTSVHSTCTGNRVGKNLDLMLF